MHISNIRIRIHIIQAHAFPRERIHAFVLFIQLNTLILCACGKGLRFGCSVCEFVCVWFGGLGVVNCLSVCVFVVVESCIIVSSELAHMN